MPLLSNCTKWSLFGLFTSLSFTICVHQLPFSVKRWIEFHFNLRKSCTKKIVHEKILSCTNREIVHDFFRARIRARYFSWFRTLGENILLKEMQEKMIQQEGLCGSIKLQLAQDRIQVWVVHVTRNPPSRDRWGIHNRLSVWMTLITSHRRNYSTIPTIRLMSPSDHLMWNFILEELVLAGLNIRLILVTKEWISMHGKVLQSRLWTD